MQRGRERRVIQQLIGQETALAPLEPQFAKQTADGLGAAESACPGRDSNPHAPEGTADFKSAAAATYATRAGPEAYSEAERGPCGERYSVRSAHLISFVFGGPGREGVPT